MQIYIHAQRFNAQAAAMARQSLGVRQGPSWGRVGPATRQHAPDFVGPSLGRCVPKYNKFPCRAGALGTAVAGDRQIAQGGRTRGS